MIALVQISGSLRYYFNYFVFGSIFTIASTLCIPTCMFRPGDLRNARILAMICRSISWIIGLQWEIRGHEHLAAERACIFVANHQSALDVLGVAHLVPVMQKCIGVARNEVFYVWPFGLAFWLCGSIFIYRNDLKKTKIILDRCVLKCKKEKVKMWIFAEGTRRNTGEIHEFKKGAFYSAVNGQLPIVPVVFSSYYFISEKKRRFTAGKIIITALPMISTEGLTVADIPDLINKTRTLMQQALDSANKEIQLSLKN